MTQLTGSVSAVKRTSFAGMECSVAQSLEVVGEWWTLLIVRDALLGVRRFEQFQERLRVSRNVLAERLDKLVGAGVLRKELYQERPRRHQYRLTEKGRDLYPIIVALRQWGDRHAQEGPPPVLVEHLECGHTADAVLICGHCGGPVTPLNVRAKGRLVPVREAEPEPVA